VARSMLHSSNLNVEVKDPKNAFQEAFQVILVQTIRGCVAEFPFDLCLYSLRGHCLVVLRAFVRWMLNCGSTVIILIGSNRRRRFDQGESKMRF
jgi:hypothetical protein